jgi:hypothetical protein
MGSHLQTARLDFEMQTSNHPYVIEFEVGEYFSDFLLNAC